jgi:hypothetical protein
MTAGMLVFKLIGAQLIACKKYVPSSLKSV